MIELAFSEGFAGALKVAKSIKQGSKYTGAIGVIGGTKKEQKEAKREYKKKQNWSGVTMEGSGKDVEALTLALDMGDISDMNTDKKARKKLLDTLFADYANVSDEIWEQNQHALTRIQEARTTLEPIRMWIGGEDPQDLCGLYYICHSMLESETPLFIVSIPKQIVRENTLITYRNTGEVPAEEIGGLIQYEKKLSLCERNAYANIWSDLVSTNASLRAVINGKLCNVPADFYDFALRSNMPEGEWKIAGLLGKTLIQIPGVGDRWLYLRLQEMIKSGVLLEVSNKEGQDHPYSQTIMMNSKLKQ